MSPTEQMFHVEWVDGHAFICGPCNTCETFLTGIGCKVHETREMSHEEVVR